MKILPPAFLLEMRTLLGEDYDAFLAAFDRPSVRGAHLNLCKPTGQYVPDPADASPLPFAPDAFLWCGEERVGTHPLHHAGAFYMQEPSAMLPVCCLPLSEGMRVLDLCAAPGGKSTQIANRVGEGGLLVANEIVPARCAILAGNLERMGVRQAVVTRAAPDELAPLFPDFFDAIVVDAPCSGEGMFRRDENAVAEWSENAPVACAERQAGILDHAARMLRPGGMMVYSTCTWSLSENEGVVVAFLSRHPDFSLCPPPEAVRKATSPGVAPDGLSLAHPEFCRRRWHHLQDGEGQFMALLRKSENADHAETPADSAKNHNSDLLSSLRAALQKSPSSPKRGGDERSRDRRNVSARKGDDLAPLSDEFSVCARFFSDVFPTGAVPFDLTSVVPFRGGWTVPPARTSELPAGLSPFLYALGVRVGEVRRERLIPYHHFFTAYGDKMTARLPLDLADPRLSSYLRGEEIPCDLPDGWACVTVLGYPLGAVKVSSGTAKNHYPSGIRNRS